MTKRLSYLLPILLAAFLAFCLPLTLPHPSPAFADEASEAQGSQEQVDEANGAIEESTDVDADPDGTELPGSWDDTTLDEEEGEEPVVPELLTLGWNKGENGAWRYGLNDGTAKTGWLKLNGAWYYLDPANDGIMVTGLKIVNGISYHFAPSGKMTIGWAKESGLWYYAANSGALKTGWLKISGTWYWLNPDNGGAMDTGLFEANGEWFTAGSDGSVRIDKWSYIDGTWYRVDMRGETITGWFKSGDKKYWLEPELHGAMAVGLFKANDYSYYAEESGSVISSQWIEHDEDLFFAGLDGALTQQGFRNENGGIVLKDEAGNVLAGLQTIGGCKLYANPEAGGELAYGWIEDTNGKYWANGQGIIQTGWLKLDGNWYYFADDGKMTTGWQKVEGTWYYLAEDGKMATGWLKLGNDWYYLKASGAMITGLYVIDGQTYKFASSGKWIDPKVEMTSKAQSFSSSTNWLILVDTTQNKVSIFKGSKGNWTLQKHWTCSAGAPVSPTVKGTFTVGYRGTHFGEEKGYTCWYWTQFCGDYLFHSVLYEPYSKTEIQDGRLGQNLSHGCIRLHIDNAKWIYDNIPSGTKVYVY